ncbi:MAG TPA: metalloregulator ArsR/SmtB family transcription factor [Actinomycetota bacterium]|nr:metalloregulator ArsR/SmtB family transcription factor [Actinomycetota bacterium]
MNQSTILEQWDLRRSDPTAAFAALGDPARLAVLRELQSGTTCVCQLAPSLGMAPNLLSYHLRVLREAGLVEGARRGRRVDYRVRPLALQELAVELVRLSMGGGERAD